MSLPLLLGVLSAAVTSSFSCHLDTVHSVETRVKDSDVVLAARITRGKAFDDIAQSFDVEADVYCVYKRPAGFPLSSSVTIQHVGHDADVCFTSNLRTGVEYILFLSYYPEKNQLIPADAEILMSPDSMRQLASVCDTKLEIPKETGAAIESNRCPEPIGGSNCHRYVAATVRQGTTPVSGTHMWAPSLIYLLISSLLAAL